MRSRDIISGKERGAAAGLIRLLLCFLAWFYEPIIRLRNWLYDHQWLKSTRLSVPVICVGNITAGGTGKTPMVIWLCRRLLQQGRKVALLSRGYKSNREQDNDENQLLQQALPQVTIVVDADRIRGGRRAIDQHQADILVMDDGFQHRRLARDLDIVMVDATCSFGYDAMLPRGLLREPISQLKRADAVVLSRCDQIESEPLAQLQNRIEQLVSCGGHFCHSGAGRNPLYLNAKAASGPMDPGLRRGDTLSQQELARANGDAKTLLLQCEHRPMAWLNAQNEPRPCEQLKGQRVWAFCGIGQPHSFEKTLIGLGAEVIGRHFFPDHHPYCPIDMERMTELAQKNRADLMMTTQKDWVKISPLGKTLPIPLYWLKVEMDITWGSEELIQRLENL